MRECNQCGKCCIAYSDGGLSASTEEIDWWENYRPEIFKYVRGGKIWMDPESGAQLSRCPWLKKLPDQAKYICDIYYDRPDDCKHYPVTIDQMIKDECEMLEVKDLSNLKRAQNKLDILMIESRPSS
ncbi:MAG: YkgJ family cysteine cluster protein [Pseudomonadales bacterium]|jgi:Fe-S-cluster containining protein